ncbi:MAG: hypothetical protein CME62_06200 [Halobacteriovoraceae bacterium]|nr:hypothetical protein [Halobacteriovoraceae bacterium]|tara:strand:- start:10179 stop:10877 length:699 start_codon:yes stop_codon:yes gene_type:complete
MIECSLFERRANIHSKVHAKYLDKYLGFKIPKIEVKLQQKYRSYDQSADQSNKKKHFEGTQTWIGLHPQALQTPYNDIYEVLESIKTHDIETVVDIGAGYGRVGLVTSAIFPKASFLGYEILSKRRDEANRVFKLHGLDNCELVLQNVLEESFQLPDADVYFIYDFSELDDICTILDELSERLIDKSFFLITKGDRIDYLIAKKYKEFWRANGYLQFKELKVYSSHIDLKQE